MSAEATVGWEVLLMLRGRDASGPEPGPAADIGTVRLFVIAPDLTRAEQAAIEHVRDHTHAAATHQVTEARVARISRIDDCCVIWRAVVH